MLTVDLNGSWTLTDTRQDRQWPAQVPGCVHTDLLKEEVIPDPWFRDQEKDIHWVCKQDWVYEREFEVDTELLDHDQVILQCLGLDTFAEVRINGETVLEADNMFRTWEIDVKAYLKPDTNRITVYFTSPIPYMKKRHEKLPLYGWNHYHPDFLGKSYVRKMACAFGWDWGLMAPTAGIWRPIRLLGRNGRIEQLYLHQNHCDDQVVVSAQVNVDGAGQSIQMTLRHNGPVVAQTEEALTDGIGQLAVLIDQPELWWPNGMGDQPLYDLTITLLDDAGEIVDEQTRRIGLRTIELVREPDRFGESFRFRVNGRAIFIKGANWIPADVFPSRVSDATYRDLLQSAADSHMNMIRIWGGGIYEDDRFYDLCDELGLLLWHDFMFACSTYPAFDDDFMESVTHEAIDNIQRLHHHPCMGLWCGNNEIEQGLVKWTDDGWDDRHMPEGDYKDLFDELLPELVNLYDGATPYWPSSAHTPGSNRAHHNDPRKGDAHAWSVWFGGEPLEAQRQWTYRFMSEFGFQSFPELKTVESFTLPEDRQLTGWIMDYHQRSHMGNQTIYKYMLDWFCPPKDLESSLWLTQLIQGLTVQYAAEHARRIQGQMDGLMYWQLNDLWPGATWSSIDVYGRWKALQHMSRRFFAPILVSLLESADESTVEIHISNHRARAADLELTWMAMTMRGEVIELDQQAVTIDSQTNKMVQVVDCHHLRLRGGQERLPLTIQNGDHRPYQGDRDLIIFARVTQEDCELSRNIATFVKPKHLNMQRPTMTMDVTELNHRQFELTLETNVPAMWVRLDLGQIEGRCSDNFMHLVPGISYRVTVTTSESITPAQLREQVKAVPICDYWL